MIDIIVDTLNNPNVGQWVRAGIQLIVGLALVRLVTSGVMRLLANSLNRQQKMLLQKGLVAVLSVLVLLSVMHQLGFKLSVLFGAAGILTVALGFASQTSMSNLISGLFMIGERPFVIGDTIKVGDKIGEVLSIDLLSVKLRTFDNLFVRIPNNSLINTDLTNMSRFPMRRFDLQIVVGFEDDLDSVRELFKQTADKHMQILIDPEPVMIFQGFVENGVNVQFSVWAMRENFLAVRNTFPEDLKEALRESGFSIPYPHRVMIQASKGRKADDGAQSETLI